MDMHHAIRDIYRNREFVLMSGPMWTPSQNCGKQIFSRWLQQSEDIFVGTAHIEWRRF